MYKFINYVIVITMFTQCKKAQTQHNKTSSNNTNKMEIQLQDYKQQKHRFEFRKEKLFYNEKHLKLDQNMAYYDDILGKDYIININDIVVYNNLPISMNKGIDDQVDNIRIQLYYYDEKMLNHKQDNETWGFPPKILDNDYILIDGIPVNKDTDIKELNKMLIEKKEKTFKQKFKGTSSVEREYLSVDSPLENIYISFGELSNLSFILYSDGSTSSD